MGNFRRLSLAFLLILFLAGLAVHSIAPVSGLQHALSESTCAFHAGILTPEILQSHTIEARIPIQPGQDDTHALGVGVKITHPPTI